MKLYHQPVSGHAHWARRFLSLLSVPHEAIEVDPKAGGHKKSEFLVLNPSGQVPEEVIGRAHTLLGRLEAHLAGRVWLVGERLTIAKGTHSTATWRAPAGNVDLAADANLKAFLRGIEVLPGFLPFVQISAGLTAAA